MKLRIRSTALNDLRLIFQQFIRPEHCECPLQWRPDDLKLTQRNTGAHGALMNLSQLFGLACLGLLVAIPTWAEEQPPKETCPHPKGWKPTDGELQRVLSDHRLWVEKQKTAPPGSAAPPDGRVNLCNANLREVELNKTDLFLARLNEADLFGAKLNEVNLSRAELNKANLSYAELNKANLSGAELNEADLSEAELNKANLSYAELNKANLSWAKLNKANLSWAKLNEADLSWAELQEADLSEAELNEANLLGAELNKANLSGAELNKADLYGAELNKANLSWAKLNEANLSRAKLNEAHLGQASVAGARLDNADLTAAHYAPNSAAPDPYVAQIKGVATVTFPAGEEVGLVQLRELFQKAGLRDLERQATFAIENGRSSNNIAEWHNNLGGAAEGLFRKVAFDFTTRYGLDPARALLAIVAVWALLIPVYAWPIWRQPKHSKRANGIYRVLPKDRIETHDGKPSLDNPARVERLHARGLATLGWSAYFSLLSAFQIGFREFSVGTWLTRAQPRSFALEATGWVRTLSGLQSLLSVYLLAMWLLTYFGRPFQ
jgi:uncharacterized protein YjbI with pentapeptide repeats